MVTRDVKIGMVQMGTTLSRSENVARASEMIAEAAHRGADVVCLPELFSARYFPREKGNEAPSEPVPGPTTRALSKAAKENSVIIVGGSVCERAGSLTYNTCAVFSEEGKMLGTYRKVHLPQDEHYYEKDYFEPGRKYRVFRTSRGNLGTLICFDQWYPEAARINRLMGAQILFYPTSIGWVEGIEQVEGNWKAAWEAVQVGHAISNSMVVCAVNRVGIEGGTTFWGGSFVCDQFGKVLARAGSKEESVYVVSCDLGLGKMVEEGWGFFRNRRKETYQRLIK